MLLASVLAFIIGYLVWDVPDPRQVAQSTKQSIVLKYADGTEMTRIVPDNENRILIGDLSEVSEPMRNATLAAEDASFYRNSGFDVFGILRAVYAQLTGSPGGGSTLTQQYIKLATGNDEHSYMRKFKEIVLAFKMTNTQSKDEIFKAYLNIAYYGRGAYGIHAAADAFFDKLPRDLTVDEAAVLAGMVQRPEKNDPRVDEGQALWRWTYVANEMLKHGMIDQQTRDRMRMPMTQERFAWRGEEMSGPLYHIRGRVLAELEDQGMTRDSLHRTGYTVVTTIDREAQRAAEEAVARAVAGQPNLRPALVAIEPNTGAVRAYHGGDTKIGGFDWARAAQPPGAAMQPFVAAAGLMQGRGIGEIYDGNSPLVIDGATYKNSGPDCQGPCSVRNAMISSSETAFVNMTRQFGPDKVRDAALRAGISPEIGGRPALQDNKGNVGLDIAMGNYPVSTADIARGYATFAAGGVLHKTHFVKQVLDSSGDEVANFADASTGVAAFSSDLAVNRDIAGNVTETMSLQGIRVFGSDRFRPVAVKNGSAQFGGKPEKSQASWTVGYTPQIATAVSISASDKNNRPVALQDNSPDGQLVPKRVWQEFMGAYLRNKPIEQFLPFSPIGQYGDAQANPLVSSPPILGGGQ